ncbi:MAG: helix-turn-helix domain-containing protein [Candidatus Contendobacter sp.]|nr:helix-turn-helix domain-containing protein [Candidatus Contendobacter sp.]
MNPLQQSIAAAGGMKPLAQRLGVRYQAIQQWRRRGRPPAERCLEIERLTGVSRYELRPDIYGPLQDRSAA